MSEITNILWASSTASPWLGCSRVSEGCKNCYSADLSKTKFEPMIREAYRKAKYEDWATMPLWGDKAPRVLTKGFWNDIRIWNRKDGQRQQEYDNQHDGTMRDMFKPETLPERPPRRRIFPSLDDWLDEMPAGIIDQEGNRLQPIKVLADLLALIRECTHIDWLLLTKRPENFHRLLEAAQDYHFDHGDRSVSGWIQDWLKYAIYPHNVWIGVSVENQKMADERIPLLLKIPACVRFLSVEPLLERVEFSDVTRRSDCVSALLKPALYGISWVIIGGESGPNRRDCGVEAIHDVARQCVAAEVPCFVKQDCSLQPGAKGRISDAVWKLKHFPILPAGSQSRAASDSRTDRMPRVTSGQESPVASDDAAAGG